jgi:polygalacturonase
MPRRRAAPAPAPGGRLRLSRRNLLGAGIVLTIGAGAAASSTDVVIPESYAGVGNATVDDTSALTQAVNAAGSGQPVLLSGRYRVTAPIALKSGTEVHLAPGSEVIRDFDATGNAGATFVNADQTNGNTDITVSGTGRIYTASSGMLGKHFGFVKVTTLRLLDVTLDGVYGDWNTVIKDCTGVRVRGLRMNSGTGQLFADGLHIYGGSDVTVSDCVIRSGDDAISLTVENATNGWLEDVVITNCVLTSTNASGLKIHAKAPATTGVRRVAMSNLDITHSSAGVGVWLRDEIGTSVHDVTIDGMTIDAAAATNTAFQSDGLTGLTVDNLTVANPSGRPICIQGGSRVLLRNPRVYGQRQSSPAQHDVRIDAATGVDIDGGTLTGATGNGIMLGSTTAVSDIHIHGVTISNAAGTGVRIVNGSRVRVTRCRVKSCSSGYIEDAGTDNVVENNDFRGNNGSSGSPTSSTLVARNNLGDTGATG